MVEEKEKEKKKETMKTKEQEEEKVEKKEKEEEEAGEVVGGTVGGEQGLPALRCPTTSARLPFFTLVMKAPNLPDSVILPPTTCTETHTHTRRVAQLHATR